MGEDRPGGYREGMGTGLTAPLPATGQEPVSPLPQRNSRNRSNAASSLSAKTSRTDKVRASAVSRKCWDMVASEYVEIDARMPQVVAQFASLFSN